MKCQECGGDLSDKITVLPRNCGHTITLACKDCGRLHSRHDGSLTSNFRGDRVYLQKNGRIAFVGHPSKV
jgi:uncharacterized Zn finger protein